jgi:chromosome segregation ATPase
MEAMVETLPLATFSILFVGIAIILVIAGFFLRSARKTVDLAGNRLEHIREEQDRLAFMSEEQQRLEKELQNERRQRLEAQRELEHMQQEHSAELERTHSRLTKELEGEREQRLEAQRQAEEQEQEHLRVQQEFRRVAEELEKKHMDYEELRHRFSQERSERELEKQAYQYAEWKASFLERELFGARTQEASGDLVGELTAKWQAELSGSANDPSENGD